MNAKARKKEKRKQARGIVQEQATHNQASSNEAGNDNAAHDTAVARDDEQILTQTEEQRKRDTQYMLKIAAYMTHLADYQLNDLTDPEPDKYVNERQRFESETSAVHGIMPVLMAQVKAVVGSVRGNPKKKKFNLEWSIIEDEDAPKGGAPKGAVGTSKEGTTDVPPVKKPTVEAGDIQVSSDDAVTTQHAPNLKYNGLWESAIAAARCELSECVDDNEVHECAVKIFRIRKKRLKAKVKKGHDQHVVAKCAKKV